MSDLPANLLRGVRSGKWIRTKKEGTADEFQYVAVDAFLPEDKTREPRVASGKSDGCECSINWEDDDGAITVTRKGRHGVARLELRRLAHVAEDPSHRGCLTWEREPVESNPYHGNLVFSAKAQIIWGICTALAGIASVLPDEP